MVVGSYISVVPGCTGNALHLLNVSGCLLSQWYALSCVCLGETSRVEGQSAAAREALGSRVSKNETQEDFFIVVFILQALGFSLLLSAATASLYILCTYGLMFCLFFPCQKSISSKQGVFGLSPVSLTFARCSV